MLPPEYLRAGMGRYGPDIRIYLALGYIFPSVIFLKSKLCPFVFLKRDQAKKKVRSCASKVNTMRHF